VGETMKQCARVCNSVRPLNWHMQGKLFQIEHRHH
jgi:hypothetical protein